jgi:hypothetical protein
MDILTEIGLKCSTDKAVNHHFTQIYNEKLSNFRNTYTSILEIGVFLGQSLRMWKEYFPKATIYGFDIEDRKYLQEDRIVIEQGDQTDINFLQSVFNGVEFDLIIDDGGHTMLQQQVSIVNIFNRLKSGGIYILEDLHTSLLETKTESTTLSLLKDIKNINCSDYKNFYVTEEQILNLKNQIEFCEVYSTNNGQSITSYIVKK